MSRLSHNDTYRHQRDKHLLNLYKTEFAYDRQRRNNSSALLCSGYKELSHLNFLPSPPLARDFIYWVWGGGTMKNSYEMFLKTVLLMRG